MAEYKQVDWEHVRNYMFRNWEQGQHIMICGPTGVGKTTLLAQLVSTTKPRRKCVVVFVTKTFDDTLNKDFPGYEVIHEWPPKAHQNFVLLWPQLGKRTMDEFVVHQREVFLHALNSIFRERNWCVCFDELQYMCDTLKLARHCALYQHQARSSGLSVITGFQRPANLPVVTYSAATHAFIWRNKIDADLSRLREVGGFSKTELGDNMDHLGDYEFIYSQNRKGIVVRSQVDRKS